jgi:hypothetical protein
MGNQHQGELDVFYQLFDAMSKVGDRLCKNPYSTFKTIRPKVIQQNLVDYHAILVEGVPFQPRKFDWEGLRGIFGDTSNILCIGTFQIAFKDSDYTKRKLDYTMEVKQDIVGSVRDLIDATDGNIIATKRAHIIASGHRPPKSLASDEISWLFTIDLPFCKRKQNVPQSETQWEAASTKGAFERWTVPQHGYCTFINVVTGAQWVFIARSKRPGFTYGADDLASFEPYGANSHLWDVEGVLLKSGNQL